MTSRAKASLLKPATLSLANLTAATIAAGMFRDVWASVHFAENPLADAYLLALIGGIGLALAGTIGAWVAHLKGRTRLAAAFGLIPILVIAAAVVVTSDALANW